MTLSIISKHLEKSPKTLPFKEIRKIAKQNPELARQLLVQNNLKLAHKLAHRYQNKCELDDVISAALYGLQIASERFDFNRNNQFTTFAFFWIKKYIIMFVQHELKQKTMGTLNENEYKFVVSLDSPVFETDESLHEIISADTIKPDDFECIKQNDDKEFLENLIDTFLSETERVIVRRRFLDITKTTLNDLAIKLNTNINNIKLEEKRSLEKLKLLITTMKLNIPYA